MLLPNVCEISRFGRGISKAIVYRLGIILWDFCPYMLIKNRFAILIKIKIRIVPIDIIDILCCFGLVKINYSYKGYAMLEMLESIFLLYNSYLKLTI